MAVHTGEAEERQGDYFGPPLNRAARVMAAGHGGQILVTATSAALVDGIDLLDLGEHRLRDLSGVERLFEVRAASGDVARQIVLRLVDPIARAGADATELSCCVGDLRSGVVHR